MSERPPRQPSEPSDDSVPAADPGDQAPAPTGGFGEQVDPDVFPEEEPDAPWLGDAVRDRPEPPFRTPSTPPQEPSPSDQSAGRSTR